MKSESEASLYGDSELPASGEIITAITLDSNVVLFLGPDRSHEIRIENDIHMRSGGKSFMVHYDPFDSSGGPPTHLCELAQVVNRRASHVLAYVDGVLKVLVAGEIFLTIEPTAKFEAWTYTHGQFLLSCPPGGFRRQH